MKRFPGGLMSTCVIPWDAEYRLIENQFRQSIRQELQGTQHLYVFGTAGEGYAVSDRQFDQIVTVGAKTHWRSGISLPVVIRMPTGGGVRGGPFHASSPEGWFVGVAGLKVVCPSNPYDAKGLMLASIRDADPVLFFEHIALYRDPRIKQALARDAPAPPGAIATVIAARGSVAAIRTVRKSESSGRRSHSSGARRRARVSSVTGSGNCCAVDCCQRRARS
mgnify:CR=1 FL=1